MSITIRRIGIAAVVGGVAAAALAGCRAPPADEVVPPGAVDPFGRDRPARFDVQSQGDLDESGFISGR